MMRASEFATLASLASKERAKLKTQVLSMIDDLAVLARSSGTGSMTQERRDNALNTAGDLKNKLQELHDATILHAVAERHYTAMIEAEQAKQDEWWRKATKATRG